MVVAGGGIGGLAAAVALHQKGMRCKVYESTPDLRSEGSGIGIWSNGWKALDELGVGDELRSRYLPLSRIELCRGESGKVLRSFTLSDCDPTGEFVEFRGVHRSALVDALASKLPPGSIEFSTSVNQILSCGGESKGVVFSVSRGEKGEEVNEECSILIGADGVRSRVAAGGLGLAPPNYSGYIAIRGVARLGRGQKLPLPPNTIRQLWGQGIRSGFYPLTENELYWFVTINTREEAIEAGGGPEDFARLAASAVAGWHPSWGMQEIISSTPLETISRGRTGDRWCLGPWGKGCVTLLGDSMHPMTPNLGQGGCVALEGAVNLARELSSSTIGSTSQIEQALRRYEKERGGRCLPLTIRAGLMGTLLQIDNPLVCLTRDTFISSPAFSPSHFLDHVKYERPKTV